MHARALFFVDIARLPLHHSLFLLSHPFSCFFHQGSRDRLCSSLLDAECSSPSTGKSAAEGLGLTGFLDRFCWKQVSTARAPNCTHFLSEISLTLHSAPDEPIFLARLCRMPSVSGCFRRSGVPTPGVLSQQEIGDGSPLKAMTEDGHNLHFVQHKRSWRSRMASGLRVHRQDTSEGVEAGENGS